MQSGLVTVQQPTLKVEAFQPLSQEMTDFDTEARPPLLGALKEKFHVGLVP